MEEEYLFVLTFNDRDRPNINDPEVWNELKTKREWSNIRWAKLIDGISGKVIKTYKNPDYFFKYKPTSTQMLRSDNE